MSGVNHLGHWWDRSLTFGMNLCIAAKTECLITDHTSLTLKTTAKVSVHQKGASTGQVSLGEVKDKVGSSFSIGWSPCMKVKRD